MSLRKATYAQPNGVHSPVCDQHCGHPRRGRERWPRRSCPAAADDRAGLAVSGPATAIAAATAADSSTGANAATGDVAGVTTASAAAADPPPPATREARQHRPPGYRGGTIGNAMAADRRRRGRRPHPTFLCHARVVSRRRAEKLQMVAKLRPSTGCASPAVCREKDERAAPATTPTF